jgi:hypothetical protein
MPPIPDFMYGVVVLEMSGVVLLASKAFGTDMTERVLECWSAEARSSKIYAETKEFLVFLLVVRECREQRQGLRK